MKASVLEEHRAAPDLSRHQLATVTGDLRNRKPRNLCVGEPPRLVDRRAKITQSRPEYDGNLGLQAVQPFPDRGSRGRCGVHSPRAHPSAAGPCRALITTRKMAPGSTEPDVSTGRPTPSVTYPRPSRSAAASAGSNAMTASRIVAPGTTITGCSFTKTRTPSLIFRCGAAEERSTH